MTWKPEHHEKYGVCRRLYAERCKAGWNANEVATTPPKANERFEYNGVYATKSEHRRAAGITCKRLSYRILAGHALKDWFIPSKVKPRKRLDLEGLSKSSGIKKKTLCSRLRRMSLEEALAMPVQEKHRKKDERPQEEPERITERGPIKNPINCWLTKPMRAAA